MDIKQVEDVNLILPLHKEIFGNEFPINSYYKKLLNHKLYIFVYEDKNRLIGYSIVVEQSEEKNLYAWYGGVIPCKQGNGITNAFFDKLIELASQKEYLSVTVATYNTRPHMLRFAIKKGFDIYDIKKRDYGSGNKIYFKYLIHKPTAKQIDLIESEQYVKPAQIEEKLVTAYKNNCQIFYFNGAENIETLYYAVKYCNSFYRKPKIIITKNRKDGDYSFVVKEYLGDISIE